MADSLKKVFTIPNVISFVRILLIPVFAWAYLQERMVLALVLVAISGLSDKLDGTLARRMHQVSELGKLLDPVADKLTQVTLAVLMFIRFHASANAWMRAFAWVFLGFIAKEVFMLLFALFMLLIGKRPGAAEIWGKAATVAFYVVMLLLFLAGPEVGVLSQWFELPQLAVQILVILNLVLAFTAFFSYFPDTYRKLFKEGKTEEKK
ncbi:MAG: CDP-alcohol phosphatidyltransferase family protein [Oscillospiraceae bacterium]|nr:CDP-alcohol phosphatidyltransferase family protein [Oscillospiraceae bacterium]